MAREIHSYRSRRSSQARSFKLLDDSSDFLSPRVRIVSFAPRIPTKWIQLSTRVFPPSAFVLPRYARTYVGVDKRTYASVHYTYTQTEMVNAR